MEKKYKTIQKLKISVGFNVHDMWVGVYWKVTKMVSTHVDVYICILPMLPVHIEFISFKLATS